MKFTSKQIIIGVGLLTSLPLFFIGVKGLDAVNHLIISRLFAEQFLAGDIYPRWLFKAEAGFGSPILYHFPALQYYIAVIFYPLHYLDSAFSLPVGALALFAAAILAIVLSGVFTFKYLNLFTDEKTALLAAIFYMTSAYSLGIDLYYRFAFSELWALAFIPLCLYYLHRSSLTGLAFSVAALVFSHLLSAVVFLPALLAYMIFSGKARMITAIIFGIGISAFYWLPAISNLNFISSQLGVGIYNIDRNFLSLNSAQETYVSAIALLIIIAGSAGLRNINREKLFWLAILAAGVFMALPWSGFIWHILTPLAALSFPWRFLILGLLAATCLIIYLPPRFITYLIVLNLILAFPGIMARNPEDPQKYLSANLLTIDDFRTRWTAQELVTEGGHKSAKELKTLEYDAVKLEFLPREIVVDARQSGLITLPQFYFPNWQSEYELNPQSNTGLMQVKLPRPGRFLIHLKPNPEEKTGAVISLLSLSLLAVVFIFIRRHNHQKAYAD